MADQAAADQAASADAGHQAPLGGQGPDYPGYIPYRHRPPWGDPEDEGAEVRVRRAQAYPPPPWYLNARWWTVGAVVAAVALVGAAIGAGGGGGGADEGEHADTVTATSAADATAAEQLDQGQEVHAIGEAAHTRNFDVTVLRVVDPYTPTTLWDAAPGPGHHLVAVELQATNTTDQELLLSTFGTGLSDSQRRPWDVAIAGVDRPRFDGFVAPDETRRGWIVFEVADDATGLHLRLKGNLSATGSLFDLG